MTGDQIKEKLMGWGFQLTEVAALLGISPQAFQSKLDSKDLKLSFILDVGTAIKKSVYELIDIPPLPTRQPAVRGDSVVQEPEIRYANNSNSAIVKMPVMDMRFAAGISSYAPEHADTSDFVSIPTSWVKKGATYACGRIRGDSMAPTLLDGGYGIIRLLDQGEWNNMPNEEIYVVVTKDSQLANLQVKRVKNRMSQGFIVMMSDNPDKASNPNFNVYAEEIISIWHMDWYFTSRMPNIHNQYYSRLQSLEDKVEDLLQEIRPVKRK